MVGRCSSATFRRSPLPPRQCVCSPLARYTLCAAPRPALLLLPALHSDPLFIESRVDLAVKPGNFDHHALQNPVCTERFSSVTPRDWHNAIEYIGQQGKQGQSVLVSHWRDLKSKRAVVVEVEGNSLRKRKRRTGGSSSGVWHGLYDQ